MHFVCVCGCACACAHACLDVQAETMQFRTRWPDYEVCAHTPAAAVEWLSDSRPGIVPYGLLVRVWPADGPEPAFFRSPVDPP